MKQLTTTLMTSVCPICGSKFEFESSDIEEIDDPEYYNSENDITCPGVTCPACSTEITMKDLKACQEFSSVVSEYKDPDEQESEQPKRMFGSRY